MKMIRDEIHNILHDTRQLLEEKGFEKAEILYVLENTKDIKIVLKSSYPAIKDNDFSISHTV